MSNQKKTPSPNQTYPRKAKTSEEPSASKPQRTSATIDGVLDRSVEQDLNAASERQSRIERELMGLQHSPRVWTWVVRVAFAVVFIVNVQCALVFVFDPATYAPAYQLSGPEGSAAVAGIGVAFLMWNCTYPLFIWQPSRFRTLGWIIMVQQTIGLIGESIIYAGLPAGYELLQSGIMGFIAFDGFGLALMAASFLPWLWVSRAERLG